MTQATVYEALGGEMSLRAIVAAFYRHMLEDDDLADVLAIHPDIERAEQRLFEFLSGRFGGPNLYWERHGHPRLRMRHMPFAIGPKLRDQWLTAMQRALDDCEVAPEHESELMAFFTHVGHHMQNRQED